MKNATSKEGINNILSEIITNENDNVYFTHICGASCQLFRVEGEGILTSQEIAERGYHDYDFDDEDIFQIWELEDEELRKNIGLDISDDELLKIKEKFCKESTQSFFKNGLYAETTQIRDTASELKGNAKDKIANLISEKGFSLNSRGNMVLILEIPKEYIYGENKENLFQTVEPMKVMSGGSHATIYTNCIPNHFIKSAVIVERGSENEYLVIDNEEFRQVDQQNMMQLFREKLEEYDTLYTEDKFKLYDEAEKLGLDFKKELDDAKARVALRNDMREYFNGKRNLTVEEINARCTALGLDFNNEMAQTRDKKLPIAVNVKENAKNVANTQISRNIQEGQTEVKSNYIEYENPSQLKDVEKQ